jgi:uncharacterized cupin superfamily protein
MTRPNAFTADFTDGFDPDDIDGYRCSEAPFGKAAGGSELLVRLYEMPAGQSLCPYHYEYVEEWLLVLTGMVDVRTPAGVRPAVAGDIVCFPSGPDGAHKVSNSGSEPARIVMFSAATQPSVCVYPDSDKVAVWTGNPDDEWRFRGAQGHLDYYDGEVPQDD